MKAMLLILLTLAGFINATPLRRTPGIIPTPNFYHFITFFLLFLVSSRLQQEPTVMLMMEPQGLPLDQTSPHIPGEFPEESNPDVVKIPDTVDNTPKKTEEESDEDDAEDEPNFFFARKGGVFNFFPIVMGGGGRGRNAGELGGSTAIANSFSTGRRGQATSHATSYGNSAAVLRNTNERI